MVTQDNKPWFLVEVKNSEKAKLSRHLKWFQEKTNTQHALQVYFDGEQVVADCFKHHRPIKVPVLSLLGSWCNLRNIKSTWRHIALKIKEA